MSVDEAELQRRIADMQARVIEPMRAEAERLLRENPSMEPRVAMIRASQTIQSQNQRRRSLWNPLSWF